MWTMQIVVMFVYTGSTFSFLCKTKNAKQNNLLHLFSLKHMQFWFRYKTKQTGQELFSLVSSQ